MKRRNRISTSLLDAPLAWSARYLAVELTLSEGRDDESALAEGGVGLGVAVAAEGDQPVEVEVRAPLGAFGDVMDVQAGPDAARLADPAGAGQDLGADLLPLLETPSRAPAARRRGLGSWRNRIAGVCKSFHIL
jgi:hypothetical protein